MFAGERQITSYTQPLVGLPPQKVVRRGGGDVVDRGDVVADNRTLLLLVTVVVIQWGVGVVVD